MNTFEDIRVYVQNSVQFSSLIQLCSTICDPMDCTTPGFPVHHQLLELAQTHVHWVSDAIQPSYPLSSLTPPALNLSQHQDLFQWDSCFGSGSQSIEVCFSISPSNEYSGLISFRIDWLDLLVVQRTLKSLLQHHSSKASILQHSVFLMVQLSHLYMTTGKKTTALTTQIFVSKMMSLFSNTLSSFVITFLLRSKCLLISWFQSVSAVFWNPRK